MEYHIELRKKLYEYDKYQHYSLNQEERGGYPANEKLAQ